MIRELVWAAAVAAGVLIWFLQTTAAQGPTLDQLLSRSLLLTFAKVYGAVIAARIVWGLLRLIAGGRR